MRLIRALEIVYDLANENALDSDYEDDNELSDVYAVQQEALETVLAHLNNMKFEEDM